MLEVTLDWRAKPFPDCFVLSLVVLVVEGPDVCRDVGGASVGTLWAGLVIRLAGCENGLAANLR